MGYGFRTLASSRPGSVTCLACREHARAEHLRLAGEIERLGGMPGAVITGARARQVAQHHRDLARRFSCGRGSGPDGV